VDGIGIRGPRRCADCGRETRAWSAVDGTQRVLCDPCLGIAIGIAIRHELARRIHAAAHGESGPGCSVCARDAAERDLAHQLRERTVGRLTDAYLRGQA
jgi:hypothetical protein